jgi:hypothetical protein
MRIAPILSALLDDSDVTTSQSLRRRSAALRGRSRVLLENSRISVEPAGDATKRSAKACGRASAVRERSGLTQP